MSIVPSLTRVPFTVPTVCTDVYSAHIARSACCVPWLSGACSDTVVAVVSVSVVFLGGFTRVVAVVAIQCTDTGFRWNFAVSWG